MKITRVFYFILGCLLAASIGANINRPKQTVSRTYVSDTPLYSYYLVGNDRDGNAIYKELPAPPPSRDLYPNWIEADSLYERGTAEWDSVAMHPLMYNDEMTMLKVN